MLPSSSFPHLPSLGPPDANARLARRSIDSTFGLYSNASSRTHGAFLVSAVTSFAPVDVVVADMPADAHLSLDAHTGRAPARVALHPAYEGSFGLYSSFVAPEVRWAPGEADPAGRGRTRTVALEKVEWAAAYGTVVWDKGVDPEKLGAVRIGSYLRKVTLDLGKVD